MHDEEIVAVRKTRHEISEACAHDVHKVAAYYRAAGMQIRLSQEFRPKALAVNLHPVADPSTAAVHEVLSQNCEAATTDVAAMHNELQS